MDGSVFMDERVDRMEYRIIRKVAMDLESGLNSIENHVNRMLLEGWQLVGGLNVTAHGGDYTLTQAVQRVRPLLSNNQTNFLNDINRMRG